MSSDLTDLKSFDYVIVGGGNAGLVAAARLVEDPIITVCVLEAGEDVTHLPDIIIPGLSFKNMGNPNFDWSFQSTPQVNANDRTIHLLRGKGLGGSTILNFMELARGHEEEYDAFETLGAKGWNWKSLLEYFKKSETFTVSSNDMERFGATVNPLFHGTEGPLHRTMSKWICDAHMPFLKTLESLGIPFNPDCSSGSNTGIFHAGHAIDPIEASRSSSATAYYEPVKAKRNLKVITGARATQILLKKDDVPRTVVAQGVNFIKDGKELTVYCRKEVIISAGTFQTPQLLELSGIGSKATLDKYGIPVILDLPGVGENLQDHFWCPFTAVMDSKYESFEVLANPERAVQEMELYEKSKSGMMSTAASSIFAFIPPTKFLSDIDVVRSSLKSVIASTPGQQKAIDIQKAWFENDNIGHLEFAPFPGFMPAPGKAPVPGKHYFSLFAGLLHPFSRGTVHINSSSILDAPNIDLRVLDNEADLEMMVQAIKFSRKVIRNQPLSGMITEEVIPGPEIESDEDIKDWIRNIIQTTFHPIGTAAMVPLEDGGVVDAELKVYGTSNLRVVDASIIPIQISSHTQATVYAIAEKAVDIIKGSMRS
ncbi:GMC oxidoreductase [Crucibulum laeve]|uniref:pyranose dehydrogenase (acceptor) n=1 Tax=Crucibulum laeve TaxID=68775 RepID=A0A5C3LMB6_9AGAR|nr:GMC oxidoreductase [Crucibulum laeve]